ncbi:dipeptide epimerase [Halovenus marina]|uniref:dipeptide epimerase n=1 Tax=Halovenus marina TaxID=3396621 RepID=UPI003F56292B
MRSDRIVATTFERVGLPLAESFTISRGSTETATNLVVRVEDDTGRIGVGAASPSEYYGETPDSVAAVLPDLLDLVEDVGDPHATQAIAQEMRECVPESAPARASDHAAARAAVSVAVHDLAARQVDEPLYRRFGLDTDAVPPTSYTVSIDTPERMAELARTAREAGFPVLKLKLGTDDDRARLEAVRAAAPEARIRVDANGDWTPEEAIDRCDLLAEMGVEFCEQPVPGGDIDGLERVRETSPIPIAADESCVTATDVPSVVDAADIVVVKLMKCGGLRPALRQIAAAQAHGLDVMLGCMVETNASIAGACQLAPLVEYVDLDGALLLDSDPYEGVPVREGQFDLTAVDSGTGARPSGSGDG